MPPLKNLSQKVSFRTKLLASLLLQKYLISVFMALNAFYLQLQTGNLESNLSSGTSYDIEGKKLLQSYKKAKFLNLHLSLCDSNLHSWQSFYLDVFWIVPGLMLNAFDIYIFQSFITYIANDIAITQLRSNKWLKNC